LAPGDAEDALYPNGETSDAKLAPSRWFIALIEDAGLSGKSRRGVRQAVIA